MIITFFRLILTYLIPCHLLTTHTLPSRTLLQPYPRLHTLFTPLSKCIRQGDLAGFDTALAAGENEFVKRRIYLTLERGRDIALRNLFRKVFIAGGFEEAKEGERIRRTRVPLNEFVAAIRLGGGNEDRMIDGDEVECLLANMIYKVSSLPVHLPPLSRFFSTFIWMLILRHGAEKPLLPNISFAYFLFSCYLPLLRIFTSPNPSQVYFCSPSG